MADGKPDLRAVFCEALNRKSSEELAQYLDTACGGDTAFRAQVEELLASHRKAGNFLGGALPSHNVTVDMPEIAEGAGASIGPYKLLEQIGEGGFGIVYMADQQAPVRRRVALKIIKPGMDTRQVLARFKAELQALSLMDHPNIARALDAGATESGRPYFVMELVRGVPITEYCDQNNLPVHERLDLFVHVCHAVQHAHQKGIIHRDIKPSNVLVTLNDGRPLPKVIDFGVAKAINQQLTSETLFTRFAEMIGTPLYMSPEQAEMTSLDIDTRADIYSLGVLLYELLTGGTPFDRDRLRKAAFDEIRRIIREEEPPKPSLRISTLGDTRTAVAAHRHVDPHRLGQLVRGDLDWIAMKALEKDRTRRYDTASSFAADVGRYLSDLPVEACPPSASYRFGKFARRNRVAFATVMVVLAAILLGTVVSTAQAIRATRAESLAEVRLVETEQARQAEAAQGQVAETRRTEAESNFRKARQAVDEYFTLVSENKLLDVPSLQPLRKQLLEAALRYYQGFSQQKSDDPQMLAELGSSYLRVAVIDNVINLNDDAIVALEQGRAIVERLRQQYPAATEQHRRLAGFWKGLRGTTSTTELPSDPSKANLVLGKLAEHWEAFVRENPSVTGFQSDLIGIYGQRAALLASLGRRADALSFMQKARPIGERLVRENPTVSEHRAALATTYKLLADAVRAEGRSQEADEFLRRVFALQEQAATNPAGVPQHRLDFAWSLQLLGDRLLRSGEAPQAEKAYRRAIEILQKLLDESPDVPLHLQRLANAQKTLAMLLQSTGRLEEAEELMRQILDLRAKVVTNLPKEPGYRDVCAETDRALGQLFAANKRYDKAASAYRQSIENYERLIAEFPNTPGHRKHLIDTRWEWGKVLMAAGRFPEGEQVFRQTIADHQKLVTDHRKLAVDLSADPQYCATLGHTTLQLGELLALTGQRAEAGKVFREALTIFQKLAADVPTNAYYSRALGQLFAANGRSDEAASAYRQSIEKYEKLIAQFPNTHEQRKELNDTRLEWGKVLMAAGRFPESEKILRQTIADHQKLVTDHKKLSVYLPADSEYRETLGYINRQLGELLASTGRHAESEIAFREALTILGKLAADFPGQSSYRASGGWTSRKLASLLMTLPNRFRDAEEVHARDLSIFQKLTAEFSDNPSWPEQLAHGYRQWGVDLRAASRPREAEKCIREAIEVLEKSSANFPNAVPSHRALLADTYGNLVRLLLTNGRPDEADKEYRKLLELAPQSAVSHNNLAWLLATCAEPKVRDPTRAVLLAKRAVELEPNQGMWWNTLGAAQYRAGNWKEAVEALKKSTELRNGGDSFDWFFVAMAQWQLGHKDEARKRFDQAVASMDKTQAQNEELKRFRTEAEALLTSNQDVKPDAPKH